MMFKNRKHGGEQLIVALEKYRNQEDVIILGLPRGGVVTAYEVAKELNLPLDITSPRKIGAPHNPELAIGAITETGEGIFDDRLITALNVSDDYMTRQVEIEKKRAQERLEGYRKHLPTRDLENKTVILVDDGIATGSTMRAAIKSVKAEGAAKVVVATPVAPPDTLLSLENEVDELICLYAPSYFGAVGAFYEDFNQTEDEEVITLLEQAHKAYTKRKKGQP